MRAPAAFLIASLALAACEGGNSPGVRVELVDANGENAAFGIVEGTLSVEVRQGEMILCETGCDTPIRGGDFELVLPIASLEELTSIQARIIGGDTPLVGGVPNFAVAGEFLETGLVPVRVLMTPTGQCVPLELFNESTSSRPRLVTARRDMAVAIRRNLVLLAGGTDAMGASNRVDFFDDIVVEMRPPLDSPPGGLGPSRGLALSDQETLVVGETSWIYENQMGPPAPVPVTLHPGADGTSALVLVRNQGVIIGGTGTRSITYISGRGTELAVNELTVERSNAAAAAGAEGAVVVGGGPGAEWISLGATPMPIDGVPESTGGWVAASPTGQTFLAIGGSGSRTTLIRGCPGACVASEGPTWDRARLGASGTPTEAGTFWIVGGDGTDAIDRVRWDGETPRIEEGPTLVQARAGAAVAEHASGVVLVVGGEGVTGLLDDVELCTPAEGLDPLN